MAAYVSQRMNAPPPMDAALPAEATAIPLARLGKDRSALVVAVHEPAQPALAEHAQRLMELGFLPGATVRVIAKAPPGGDPIAVRVGRATFALRLFEAELVTVTPVTG